MSTKKANAVLAVSEVTCWAKEEEKKLVKLYQAGKAQQAEVAMAGSRHRTMKEVLRLVQSLPTDTIDEAITIINAYKAKQAQNDIFQPKNPM